MGWLISKADRPRLSDRDQRKADQAAADRARKADRQRLRNEDREVRAFARGTGKGK